MITVVEKRDSSLFLFILRWHRWKLPAREILHRMVTVDLPHWHSTILFKNQWLRASPCPFAMRAWIIALVHFVLATSSPGTNISSTGSVSAISSSSYGGSSTTATSTATTSSTISLTSVASNPSTQAQSVIPISPASFSPFLVPSDTPVLPIYPIVNPSQPPSVSYTSRHFDICWDWHVLTIFHRWTLLNFPISDLRGQRHTPRQRQRWGLPSLVLLFVVLYMMDNVWHALPDQYWMKRANLNHSSC